MARIVIHKDEVVGPWVFAQVGRLWYPGMGTTMGWVDDEDKLVAGVTFTNFDGVNVWMDCAAMEGSRPLLVEVQALVSESELIPPRRVCNGIDRNRLALILAVLGRHAGVGVGSADVFVNVVGGVRIDEPGADLAIALAVASAVKGVVLGGSVAAPLCAFGEVGLTGELRSVAHHDRRAAEAQKFGLTTIVSPDSAPSLRTALRSALRAGEALAA